MHFLRHIKERYEILNSGISVSWDDVWKHMQKMNPYHWTNESFDTRWLKWKWTREKISVRAIRKNTEEGLWNPSLKLPESDKCDSYEGLARKYAKLTTPIPAIVVAENTTGVFSILDGTHRARAAFLRGIYYIDAFVGKK